MKIGVISDTHGDLPGWQQAQAKVFAGTELIIHAGDLLYHGPKNPIPAGYDPAKLAEAINQSPAPVVIARGNCDSEVDQLVIRHPIQAPYALVILPNRRIMAQHGHLLSAQQMAALAYDYKLDLLITGHTHVPKVERVGECVFLNPGSPSISKFEKKEEPVPTVALIEDDVARVIDLRTGKAVMDIPLQS